MANVELPRGGDNSTIAKLHQNHFWILEQFENLVKLAQLNCRGGGANSTVPKMKVAKNDIKIIFGMVEFPHPHPPWLGWANSTKSDHTDSVTPRASKCNIATIGSVQSHSHILKRMSRCVHSLSSTALIREHVSMHNSRARIWPSRKRISLYTLLILMNSCSKIRKSNIGIRGAQQLF